MSGLGYNTTISDIEAAKEKAKLEQDEREMLRYQLVLNVLPGAFLTYGSEEEIGLPDALSQKRLYIDIGGPSTTSRYQLVWKVSQPGAVLTYYGSEKIGLLDALSQKRLYIGPPSTTSTSSSSGSWFRKKWGPSYTSPPSTTSPPRCSNCTVTGCMYCQKGGKTRRRRLSTRRRRRLSTRRRRSN